MTNEITWQRTVIEKEKKAQDQVLYLLRVGNILVNLIFWLSYMLSDNDNSASLCSLFTTHKANKQKKPNDEFFLAKSVNLKIPFNIFL